jgi:hypothetical protein
MESQPFVTVIQPHLLLVDLLTAHDTRHWRSDWTIRGCCLPYIRQTSSQLQPYRYR